MKTNDIVRINRYPENNINAYGRIQDVRKIAGEIYYWVVNGNMPFSGTISNYFRASEITKVKTRRFA